MEIEKGHEKIIYNLLQNQNAIFFYIFQLSGAVVLGMGVFLLASKEDALANLIEMNVPIEIVYSSSIIMIAIGSFVFFVGFCGCCGAMRESAIMLGIVSTLKSLLMIRNLQ